jgi:hypothetical protein
MAHKLCKLDTLALRMVIRANGMMFHLCKKMTEPINPKVAEWHEIEALEDGTVFVNVFTEGKY